jgi:hypothetical protein
VLVYFKRNLILRAEYKLAAYDDDKNWDDNYFGFGI